MDQEKISQYVNEKWDNSIIPTLQEFITIPNKSPMFDSNWQANGYMDKAVKLITQWCKEQPVNGLSIEVVQLENRTPLIFMEIPGQIDNTVLLYGHLDKQPEMTGWDEGFGPWTPVIHEGKLYGRGGADDGYSAFSAITAIAALQANNIAHPNCVIIIEACEESGSYDLPHYVEHLKQRIGTPDLVICLDSMCGNYEQLWITTSLRGIIGGELTVSLLRKGIHSGVASGIVPSSFRIIRQLLSRIEDERSGEILLPELFTDIPQQKIEQAEVAASILKNKVRKNFPFVAGGHSLDLDNHELLINRAWKPALSITGAEGLPTHGNAGNVSRPYTSLKLSMRIPPNVNPEHAGLALKHALETNPPYGAQVKFNLNEAAEGWEAPDINSQLFNKTEQASMLVFNKSAAYMGEGGSIPFMGMLGKQFPEAQFIVTGVLGPKSNAHGPNEFLHLDMAKKLTVCISLLLGKNS